MKQTVQCPMCLKETMVIVQYNRYAVGACSNKTCRWEMQGGDVEAVLFALDLSGSGDDDDL